MEELINTFHIDWKLIIAQLVNFAIVLFVLWKFAIKPLSKVMDQRTEDISKSLDDAKKIEENLMKVEKENADKIVKAKQEAQAIIEDSRKQGNEQGQKMVADAKHEVQTVIAAAKEQIANEKNKMVKDVKDDLADLVVIATTKMLEKTGKSEINEKIVKETLKEIK
ncbi:F0F1 ATP synthase subunit B [bacterium]|jgi:F-type H+-transporting ATPase subunit b|nr:F0F1 ATP synthase subunit B [bacterium]MBT4121485.1 F0F1 ATP synthase subunit B [bacterium]MBT4335269.1 F0F1 ATP synthase subunit B [bacterium]MBT4495131.1 F0F1 ATP synthase subunit B [bacterium]MBT4764371.1 F0F1 ATP synthase subunit B [bacterium]